MLRIPARELLGIAPPAAPPLLRAAESLQCRRLFRRGTGSAYEVRLGENLDVIGTCDFHGTWRSVNAWQENFTAHSKARRQPSPVGTICAWADLQKGD